MKVLGIETSCDDTAVSIVEDGKKILINLVTSQNDIHLCLFYAPPHLLKNLNPKRVAISFLKKESFDFSIFRSLFKYETDLP